jgi:hypothetical protein
LRTAGVQKNESKQGISQTRCDKRSEWLFAIAGYQLTFLAGRGNYLLTIVVIFPVVFLMQTLL